MIIFNGMALAQREEVLLSQQVAELRSKGKNISIASVMFTQDKGSQLYTQLKKEAAERVGIEYKVYPFSLQGKSEAIVEKINELNSDPSVTGIIIQKPWQQTWQRVTMVDGDPKDVRQAYTTWWHYLTSALSVKKDVDGLHPATLKAIELGTWRSVGSVMPATAVAVTQILEEAGRYVRITQDANYCILGRSDLLGLPLYYEFKNQGKNVQLLGQKDLRQLVEQGRALSDFDVVISATGVQHLVTGEMLKAGVAIIDVGEPKADVDQKSVASKASFITPVPGGVGPITVVSLLKNSIQLVMG